MALIQPFRGLRPTPESAGWVIAPPYDVMNASEARCMAEGRPWSFLHVSRAEIDLPEDVDPHDPQVYAKARENLDRMLEQKILVRDTDACYYVYRLTTGTHTQTGLVCAASVAAYDDGRIKKHELTRPVKESDRVAQIDALSAQTGPVFLVYRAEKTVDRLLHQVTLSGPPEVDETAEDGVRHQLWVVNDPSRIRQISQQFDSMDAIYVADGHHRSAAASRVAAQRRTSDASHQPGSDGFLSVIFPHDQVKILAYNRILRDLNGLDLNQFMQRIETAYMIQPAAEAVYPGSSQELGMYLAGHWYTLDLKPGRTSRGDALQELPVSILTRELIEPVFGIHDQRSDTRIEFVGGGRGLQALEQRVDSGEMAVAFSLYPTPMSSLMSVADADQIMPPKSTWFEPKLADGLVTHII